MDSALRWHFLACLDHDLALTDAEILKGIFQPGAFPSCAAGPDVWIFIRERWLGANVAAAFQRSQELPPGYLLPPGKTMADVRRSDEELLASEGLSLEGF